MNLLICAPVMNVALFGGTFDPVHKGHIAVARAAQARFALARVYMVPADIPPHKQRQPITPYHHRYAMLALATQGEKDLVPSLLEAPDAEGRPTCGASYTIDTVRRFKQTLKKSDRLFFLIGIDAFLDITKWRDAEALLRECEFIVVSRPGFSLSDVAGALPESMRPDDAVLKPFRKQAARGDMVLSGAVIHLLEGVNEKATATNVREAAAKGRAANRWLEPAVAEYIKKMGLYRPASKAKRAEAKTIRAASPNASPNTAPQEFPSGRPRFQVIHGGARRDRRAARSEDQ